MRFEHSVKITVGNFSSVFKYMLYRIVTGVVFFSLIYVVLRLSLSFIVSSEEVAVLRELVKETVKCIISGNVERLGEINKNAEYQNAVLAIGRLIAQGGGAIAGAIVGVILIYLVARIVDGLATFALGAIVNDRMSIYSRMPFSTALFSTVGQGIFYELIYVPLSFLYDALTVLLCWFVFFYLRDLIIGSSFMAVAASLSLFALSFMLLEALKMTLISSWIPSMIADKTKVTKAFAQSLKNKRCFASRFVCFLSSIAIIIVVNILFCVCTLGSALLITVPVSFLFLLSVQFVYYYHDVRKKYFISAGVVFSPEDMPTERTETEINK